MGVNLVLVVGMLAAYDENRVVMYRFTIGILIELVSVLDAHKFFFSLIDKRLIQVLKSIDFDHTSMIDIQFLLFKSLFPY